MNFFFSNSFIYKFSNPFPVKYNFLFFFFFQILGGIIIALLFLAVDSSGDLSIYTDGRNPAYFFKYTVVTFFIGSLLLLLGCLVSISTGSIIAKTSYVSNFIIIRYMFKKPNYIKNVLFTLLGIYLPWWCSNSLHCCNYLADNQIKRLSVRPFQILQYFECKFLKLQRV